MKKKPNIILMMCDDLGYGDTGFNGNKVIQTPHLDSLAADGGIFTRFYAGGPVCSPTRGTCLTGRHYLRYGINHANVGHLPIHEIPLSKITKGLDYRTGHFGKWHLGTMEKDFSSKPNREPEINYAPPWERWYDESFSTEFAVPTWDPHKDFDMNNFERSELPWGSPYYENGRKVTEPLPGCDSHLVVEKTISFIKESLSKDKDFFTTVWFHAPHTPVEAGPEFFNMYKDYPADYAHYYGVVTAMDHAVGVLIDFLKEQEIYDDTIIFFCSDNGPEGRGNYSEAPPSFRRSRGVTQGLRGRKRSLYNGGIAVPALVRWPGLVESGSRFDFPASTLDYLPTLIEELGFSMPDTRPLDGESLIPLMKGERDKRLNPIPYRFCCTKKGMFDSPTFAVMDERFKLLTNLNEDKAYYQLYDMIADPYEKDNIIDFYPEEAERLNQYIIEKMDSFRRSHFGADYPVDDWKPAVDFQDVDETWK
jgi:arylsulfatase A-like enzyme